MIGSELLEKLAKTKNLLAFSAGVDSSALFFLLLENNINFDIAFVNYHTREASDLEEDYAKELASRYNKKLFIKHADLIRNNFEANARAIRYRFFEDLIRSDDYEVLITAHQLNDWSEWFLMQFTKGAGFFELSGMGFWDKKDGYIVARPILDIPRKEIENYLIDNNIKYFVDSSNDDVKYQRNRFRKDYIAPLMQTYSKGIKRTFDIIKTQSDLMRSKDIIRTEDLFIIDINAIDLYHQIDIAIKKLGVLTSFSERNSIRSHGDIVVGRKIAVCKNKKYFFVAPYTQTTIPKDIRERFRVQKIPPKIRGYLYKSGVYKQDWLALQRR